MFDWLGGVVTNEPQVSVPILVSRLALAALLGAAVAAVYFLTQRKQRTEASSFVATLVMLTVLLAMVSLVIGKNVAQAFGLVGACRSSGSARSWTTAATRPSSSSRSSRGWRSVRVT